SVNLGVPIKIAAVLIHEYFVSAAEVVIPPILVPASPIFCSKIKPSSSNLSLIICSSFIFCITISQKESCRFRSEERRVGTEGRYRWCIDLVSCRGVGDRR